MKYKIGDIVKINPESLKKNHDLETIEYLDTSSVTENKFDDAETLSANDAPSRAKRIVKDKDILISTVRPNLRHYGFIEKPKSNLIVSTGFAVLRCNKAIVEPRYLYSFLSLDSITNYLAVVAEGSTTAYPSIKPSVISDIEIDLPSLLVQKKIAHILSTLDDKIELNRKMNQTLEEMAQALFKSWFVDFDPVHVKAKCSSDEELETAAKELGISKEILELFPSEFEDSELGMIPKGWEIGHLGDKNFSMLIGSGINSFEGEKIYLATADVADTNITSQEILITYESRPSRANMQPVIGSVWFAKMQNSRKLLMFDNYSSTDSLILSTGFAGIKTTELSHCFIWSFIMSDAFNISKDNLADGAVQIAINNTSIKKINYTQPSDDILKLFTEKTSNLFRCKYQNDLEIQTLQKTRDTLLPKLLSGELDVSELDLDVE